jgi:methionine synthase II (cobalamin-independent)
MTHVHFVGSVALDTPEEVFAEIGRHCGPYLKRVPDGEPGARRLWINFQIPVLRGHASLVPAAEGLLVLFPLKLAEGVSPEDIHFGELGYAREARPSYEDFLAARRAGQLPSAVRFQVSLPTPWAVVAAYCVQPDAQKVYPAYERAMLREVQRICQAIPHHDLAIQWDVCLEMLAWDGRGPNQQPFPDMETLFVETFARLGSAVPSDVELGFHLCYGDLDARHMVEPIDATKMTELANLIARSVPRDVTWMHMPVPIDRTDDDFYAPLDNLRLAPSTELYLGLVHAKDGVEGTLKRIAAARKHVGRFGIASECGISRGRDQNVAINFIKTYAGAAAAMQATA